MDSIVHIENYKFTGRTTFRDGLLNNVVALSVQEVKGVSKGKVRSKNAVMIFSLPDGTMTVDVCFWLEPGYAVADVSYRVQENVIQAVASVIDKKVKAVNIRVANVSVPQLEGGQLVAKRLA